MKLQILNRKVHYWAAIVVAAPILVIVTTGLLLQWKKQVAWIQPTEQRGKGREPTISMARVLEICRGVPEARIESWDNINRVDIRPSRGMLKVWAKSDWEIQLDIQTGAILQVAFRRSDIISGIHDGSWFHDQVKFWVFIPTGVILLLLWLTGMYLFWLPIVVRWRRKRVVRPTPLAAK